ncbi:MAG: site-specific DNA-methyltransferase, partial [Nitrososphaera sp.]|nr:site-specific DNA-methyltransferase [Nitrososphaera sp.]
NSIQLIVTSPPYWCFADYGFDGQIGQTDYATYLHDLLKVWLDCERILAPNGKLCINTPIMPVPKKMNNVRHTRELKNLSNDIETGILNHTKLARYSLYMWQKQTTEKMFGSYPYPPNIYENNTVEFINVFVKDGPPPKTPAKVKEKSKLSQQEWMDLTRQIWWIYPEDIKRVGMHPAPFPELLPLRLIKMFTFQAVPEMGFLGDIVLDPFVGSGTTCVAAKMLNRRWIGVDASDEYCQFARRRLARTPVYPTIEVRLRRLSDADRALQGVLFPGDEPSTRSAAS